MPADIIPREDLLSWRNSLKSEVSPDCPLPVKQFIEAVASKLPEFSRIREEKTMITGYELRLANFHEYKGEVILDSCLYELPVPYMIAVDHRGAMHRIFRRKGRQGLVDYCRAHVDSTELARLIKIMDVHVFNRESEAFTELMTEIKKSA